jgi:hypothetical protein
MQQLNKSLHIALSLKNRQAQHLISVLIVAGFARLLIVTGFARL